MEKLGNFILRFDRFWEEAIAPPLFGLGVILAFAFIAIGIPFLFVHFMMDVAP